MQHAGFIYVDAERATLRYARRSRAGAPRMHENSDDLIDIVAADFLRMRGASAFAYLNERAEIAIAVSGDIESAIAW